MPLQVGFDGAVFALNAAGELRYARDLLAALRQREDVAATPLVPTARRPRTLAQRLALQSAVQGLWYPLALPRAARRAGLPLVHFPRALVPRPRGLRAATVVTVHDVLVLRAPELFAPEIRANFRLLAPGAVRRADRVVCGSEYTRRETAELLDVDPAKVAVTPWGIAPRFRPRPPDPAWLRDRFGIAGPYVLCVGTLEPRKNLAGALRAFARVAADDPGLALVVVGGGGWRNEAFERELRTVRARVVVPGFVADDELVALLSGAHCFLYPSLSEGFGFPPLEAMACGAPVVTSTRGSLPEVVGDAGLQVDPEDDDALAAALRRVLGSQPLRDDLRERGLRRAAGYSWARCAELTADAYRAALAAAGSTPA